MAVAYYLKDIKQFGIVCIAKRIAISKKKIFAWQVYSNKELLGRFSKEEQRIIESVALMEWKN